MKKKLFATLLMAAFALSLLAGCGKDKVSAADDWKNVNEKGKLVIGITLYEPMNYYDSSNTLTGFDTEYAQAVCKKLGITPEFLQINWNNKDFELNSGNVDCLWNGFTIDDDRRKTVDFTTPYVKNRQVAVVKAANADKYKDASKYNGVTVCYESGSAGEKAVKAQLNGCKTVPVSAQVDALMEVKAGTSEVAVLDYTLASSMVGAGTDYAELTIIESLNLPPEEYGVGCRKGSSLVEKINEATKELLNDGTLDNLAKKYGVTLVK